jgi:hypothetical protein
MKKKIGPLEKGIVKRPTPSGVISRALAKGRLELELHEKTLALFEKHEVSFGDFQTLALRLATKYEPGFNLIAPPGPLKGKVWLWDNNRNKKLIKEFNRFEDQGLSVREIAKRIHALRIFDGQSAEALRRQYAKLMKGSKSQV